MKVDYQLRYQHKDQKTVATIPLQKKETHGSLGPPKIIADTLLLYVRNNVLFDVNHVDTFELFNLAQLPTCVSK